MQRLLYLHSASAVYLSCYTQHASHSHKLLLSQALADMVEFDAHGRGDSRPAEERRPTPQPPENGAEGRSNGASSRPASRAASVGLPGLLGSMQHGRLDALTHALTSPRPWTTCRRCAGQPPEQVLVRDALH